MGAKGGKAAATEPSKPDWDLYIQCAHLAATGYYRKCGMENGQPEYRRLSPSGKPYRDTANFAELVWNRRWGRGHWELRTESNCLYVGARGKAGTGAGQHDGAVEFAVEQAVWSARAPVNVSPGLTLTSRVPLQSTALLLASKGDLQLTTLGGDVFNVRWPEELPLEAVEGPLDIKRLAASQHPGTAIADPAAFSLTASDCTAMDTLTEAVRAALMAGTGVPAATIVFRGAGAT